MKAYEILRQAIVAHLVYNGPCEDTDDADEPYCDNDNCTYCGLEKALHMAEFAIDDYDE